MVVGLAAPAGATARAESAASCDVGGQLRVAGAIHSTMGTGNIPGVWVQLTGPGSCQSVTGSGSRGRYLFTGLQPGTYTVTPFHAGCGFDPPQRTVTLTGHSRLASFDATCV